MLGSSAAVVLVEELIERWVAVGKGVDLEVVVQELLHKPEDHKARFSRVEHCTVAGERLVQSKTFYESCCLHEPVALVDWQAADHLRNHLQ